MGLAAAALYFGAVHSVGVVGQIDDAGFGDGLVKAGPAAAAVELGIADEQRVTAGYTVIGSFF